MTEDSGVAMAARTTGDYVSDTSPVLLFSSLVNIRWGLLHEVTPAVHNDLKPQGGISKPAYFFFMVSV